MAGIVKTVIRFGVVGGLVTGAAVLIAGPERVFAFAQQTRGKICKVIDNNIDDPIAMRAQLRSLESQYPARIAEVQGQLAEVQAQIRQIERDKSVSERVVALAAGDLDQLHTLIARAETARAEGPGRIVAISFDDHRYDLDGAYRRASDVTQTVEVYNERVADYEHDLASLKGDEEQLTTLLNKLDTEHAQFQAQLASLERQIDAVARKGRMVDLMAERQKKLDELSRYDVASLDQFKASLAKRQAELEARMTTLTKRERQTSYEDVAKVQIDRESAERSRADRKATESSFKPGEKVVIEISGDRPQPAPKPVDDGKLVARIGANR